MTAVAAMMLLACGGTPLRAEPNETPSAIATFVSTHCYDCHQGESAEAGLDLERLAFHLDDPQIQQQWVRIFDRVHSGEMPPADWGETNAAQKKAFETETRQALTEHLESQYRELGRVRGRRLTRNQVERSLQDILAVDIPLADSLPADSKTDGFTTVADGQAMSHFQLSAHLATVDRALDEAFRRALSPEDRYEKDFDAQGVARTNPKRRCREPEMREGKAVIWSSGLIFYGRIPATTAPEDGWYEFEVTVSGLKLPKTGGVWSTVRSGLCVSSAPLLAEITTFEAMEEPKTVKFTAWLPKRHMLEIRPGDDTLKKGRFAGGQVGVGEGEPQDLSGIAFDRITMKRVHRNGSDDDVRDMLFGSLTVKPSNKKKEAYQVISKTPQKDATKLLTAFASRAFRRPTTEQEISSYVDEVHAALEEGETLVDALRLGYRALLCSPRFLYFTEMPGPLDDHAIAARLSYLLTGSTPDQQLRKLADEGRLQDEAVLQAETRRLLADDGGRQFIHDFAAEWLDLDQIDFTQPDRKLYPKFDSIVQQSMLQETETYLERMLRENLGVSHLIDSDFTYLDSRLARFYEIEGVTGDELREVALPTESHRGGLLTQGAILKVTANGSNTSPVIRGVWVLERLLGDHVPPPPPNLPTVEPDIRGATTIREQLDKHRSLGECASCHVKIDPPGFALENFDAAGQWRTNYLQISGNRRKAGPKIDASHTLPDGREFVDIDGFQSLVAEDPRKLAECVAEKLIAYGTGASVTFADREEIEGIVERTAASNYGFRSVLEEVVVSPLFLSK